MKVGFIGLSIMGRPMAGRLMDGGHELYLYDRKPVAPELTARGGRACRSCKEVAGGADVIMMIVPEKADVEAALFGDEGVAQALSPGKTVVDMSFISPIATEGFARRINELGCEYLDAPVSGGEIGAKEGTLAIMVGGREQAFARVKPLFELMGKNITLVGGNGAGQIAKVANQIIVAITIEAVGEGLLFASKAGADPALVRRALMGGGFASSRVLEVHGARMIDRAFEPGFRIEAHQKDLSLALASAHALKMSLPNTATCQELFNACSSAHGRSGWDHSAIVCALEDLASHKIAGNGSGDAPN